MKKFITILIILAFCINSHLGGQAYADIDVTDISSWTTQPNDSLVQMLRDKFGQHNTDIAALSGGGNIGTGNTYYVDNGVGDDSYVGTKPEWAFATLDAAFDSGNCTANNGDYVYCMPGHAETKSTTGALFTADVEGVTIVCLGVGDDRAKFTLSHTGAKIDITADNVRFSGFYLDATGVDSVNTPINVSGEGCIVDGFFIRLSDTNGQADLGITIGIADGDANDLIIANGRISSPDAGAASAITFAKDMENVIIANMIIYGDFSSNGIDVPSGGNAQENLLILNCVIVSKNADEPAIEINGTGNTGVIDGCTLVSDAEATILDAGGLQVANTELLIIGNSEGAPLPANMTLVDLIGDFTGPDSGTSAGENIKAILDLIYADTMTTLDGIVDAILVDTGTTIPGLISAKTGVGHSGTCVSNTGDGEIVECTELLGFGDDYFNTGWSLTCILDASHKGSAPEGVTIDIIDYSSTAGIFTLNKAFSTELTTSDEILVRRTDEIGSDVPTTLGSSGVIHYVDNGTVGDGTGLTWENAYATVTLALDGAISDNGDIIYIAAGHTETLTAAYTIDDTGISLKGFGEGDLQPTMVFNSSADAQWDISVADVMIENIKFEADLADILICLDIAAGGDGTRIKNCKFVSTADADKEFLSSITLASGADDVLIEGCEFISVGGDADVAIQAIAGVVNNLQIKDCWIKGDYDNAPIYSNQVNLDCLIKDNVVHQERTGGYAIEFSGGMTGDLVDNRLYSNTYATMLDPGSMICIGNVGTDAINQQSIAIPISAETSDVTEDDDGSDLERLEYLQNKTEDILAGIRMAGGSIGDVFYCDDGGSASGAATTWATAETSLKDAYDKASAGDIVFIAPAHSETLGNAQIAFDTAGVRTIGIGDGADMAMIDMQHGSSSLDVTGASNTIKNIHFYSSTALTSIGIEVTAADCTIEDCLFTDIGDYEFAITIDLDDEAENFTMRRCRLESLTGTTGATSAIAITDGVVNRLIIEDCHIWGDFDNGGLYSDQVNTNALIKNNSITNNETTDHAIEFTAAMTGDLINNMLSADTYGSVLDPGSMRCFGNMQTVGIDSAAEDVPLVAGRSYARAMLSGDLNAVQNLFDVDGGPILITFFIGHCTVDADAATTREIELDSDDTGKDYDFSTAVDIQAVNQGDYIVFDETLGESVLTVAALGASGSIGMNVNWMCEEGLIICQNTSADGGNGNVEWYMTFTPLVNGVEVIPQAGN